MRAAGVGRPLSTNVPLPGATTPRISPCKPFGDRNFRLLPTTPAANEALDDVDAENIGRLVEQGEHLIADQGAAIANLCTALTA